MGERKAMFQRQPNNVTANKGSGEELNCIRFIIMQRTKTNKVHIFKGGM